MDINSSESPTDEASVLGLQDGASAVAAPQSKGFVADVSVDANVSATLSGSGSVDFGFVGLDFDTIVGSASASLDGQLTGQGTLGGIGDVLTFENLFKAASGDSFDQNTSWMAAIGGVVWPGTQSSMAPSRIQFSTRGAISSP